MYESYNHFCDKTDKTIGCILLFPIFVTKSIGQNSLINKFMSRNSFGYKYSLQNNADPVGNKMFFHRSYLLF